MALCPYFFYRNCATMRVCQIISLYLYNKGESLCLLHIINKAFLLYPLFGNRQFHTRRVMQSETPMLAYNHPLMGFYTGNAWDGLFISCRAFGDASNKINRTSSTLFCL